MTLFTNLSNATNTLTMCLGKKNKKFKIIKNIKLRQKEKKKFG